MSVYVDNLFFTGKSHSWPYDYACHMFADTVEELNEFANKLGLKRSWFQPHQPLPHYDLTANKRKLAVRLGAVQVDREFVILRMRGNKYHYE